MAKDRRDQDHGNGMHTVPIPWYCSLRSLQRFPLVQVHIHIVDEMANCFVHSKVVTMHGAAWRRPELSGFLVFERRVLGTISHSEGK